MSGEFDDLIDTSGAFDDLIPTSGAFDDLIPKKQSVPPQAKFTFPIEAGAAEIGPEVPERFTEPGGLIEGITRPMELAFSPLTAFRASIMAGLKKKIEGASMLEQSKEMVDWFGAGLGEWARPIGEPPISPLPTDITKHGGVGGFIENLLLDPSNLLLFGGLKNIVPRLAGAVEIEKGKKAAATTRLENLFATGEPAIEASGLLKNVPMVIPETKIVPQVTDELVRSLSTVMEKNLKGAPTPESLMGKSHAEWKLNKAKLKVTQSFEQRGEELVYRLTDQSDKKIYAEMALKEHPEQNALELAWLNIDKNGIDITKRRDYRVGKPVGTIPGLYKEIHRKLELYAEAKGYKVIGTNPTNVGKDRLKMLGFRDVADDLIGEVPYSMYKRVEQNINFEHPDFWNKYKKLEIFEKKGGFAQQQAKEIDTMASVRNMFFDLTSDGKWTFYDMFMQPIQKFSTLDDAQNFIKTVRLSDKHYLERLSRYNNAEKLYGLASDFYAHKSIIEASKEVSFYQAALGQKEFIGLETYRKFLKPETLQKISKGGENITQKITASAIEDTKAVFNIGTGETVAISANIPIKESYLTTLSKIKDTPKDFYQRILTGRGWLMPALHFFERQGADVKEMFYRRIKVAEKRAAQESKNLEMEVDQLAKQLNLGKKEFVRIGDFAIAKDPIGKATLEKGMNKVIPELTENEMKFYTFIRTKYEEFFNRVNEVRVFAGIDPIEYRGDYFTFFRNYDELEKLGYFLNTPQFLEKYQQHIHRISTAFVHEKLRKGGFIPLEENAKDIFLRYGRSAVNHIHMTPPIAINRALIKKFKVGEKTIDISEKAPQFHAWVTRWLDDVAGQRSITELPQWLERGVNHLNKNITYAFLSGNIRSALIQPTAIINAFVEVGPKYLMEGVRDWLVGANNAIKKSNVLLTREYEQSVAEAFTMFREPGYGTKFIEQFTGKTFPTMRKVSKAFQGGKQAIARAGMKPLQFFDMQTAQVTWNAAYKKAKKHLKFAEEEAINYADDVVTRTQGSGKISDLAQAQRGPIGKTLLMLQTFVNNNWSFLTRDVLGVGNATMKNTERFKKIMKLLIGAGITNIIFEDLLGTYSPFPTPVRAYMESREEGRSVPYSAAKSLKEVTELIPGPGGAIRYGSHPLGALAETLGLIPEVISSKPATKSWQELVGTIFGIPAVSQARKIVVGKKHGAGIIETILGMRKQPTKTKKGKLELQDMSGFGELSLED